MAARKRSNIGDGKPPSQSGQHAGRPGVVSVHFRAAALQRSRARIDITHGSGVPDVGTSIITLTDPSSDTVSKVAFVNSSVAGRRCTTIGPNPFNETQCFNQLAALGSEYNFTGRQPCPAPSTSTCDLWMHKTPSSEESYLFVSGTPRAVQYSITVVNPWVNVTTVTTFSKFTVNEPIPASVWQTPPSWQPCTPGGEHLKKGV